MFTEQKEVESWRQTNTFKTEMEEEKFWEKKFKKKGKGKKKYWISVVARQGALQASLDFWEFLDFDFANLARKLSTLI